MKIVEALKKLRIIEKRIARNERNITRYSSMVSTERPLFETEDSQEKEVVSLLKSNIDLVKEYLLIKNRVENTNLQVKVEIDGVTYTLSDLLILDRKLASLMISTYKSLNDNEGISRLRLVRTQVPSEGRTPYVKRFYKETTRNEGLRFWQDLKDNIISRLEVINATTDLIE